jgi:shikimate dehydrogenase
MTRLLGVIGHPIAHTLSPRMHRAAIEALGADAAYLAIDVPPDSLAGAMRDLRALDALGLNVTVPHKTAIVPLLDEIDAEAKAIGAVNTIVRDGVRWVGTNTDARGLSRALEEAGVRASRAVVIGAGGAARAAFHALRTGGATVEVIARRPEAWPGAKALGDAAALRRVFAASDLVVQATTATMSPADGEALARLLPLEALPGTAAVIDLVYRPKETALLAAARARGLEAIDGLGMLVHQGALSLELWLGRRVPVDAMRRAL